jgi:hypothetical protein
MIEDEVGSMVNATDSSAPGDIRRTNGSLATARRLENTAVECIASENDLGQSSGYPHLERSGYHTAWQTTRRIPGVPATDGTR